MSELHTYDFGSKKIWSKPCMDEPFDAIAWYGSLLRSVSDLQQYATVTVRADHYVANLDKLMFILREALFKAMVLREACTGFKTREEEQSARTSHIVSNGQNE